MSNLAKREWDNRNKEFVKKIKSEWYLRNKDKYKAANKAVRDRKTLENPHWEAERKKKRKEKNPERYRIITANNHAKREGRAATGKLTVGLSVKLYRLQRGKCACCKRPLGDDYHLDHVMPLALGGLNIDQNIQLLRAVCNMQKNAKHPVEFMQQRGFLI